MAELAQLVEHWDVAPGVTGSIPVLRPKDSLCENPATARADFWKIPTVACVVQGFRHK
jgi:hypothetical protein